MRRSAAKFASLAQKVEKALKSGTVTLGVLTLGLIAAAKPLYASRTTGPVIVITPGTSTVFGKNVDVLVMICSGAPNFGIKNRSFQLSNANGSVSVDTAFVDVSSEHGQPESCNGPDDDWEWWAGTLLTAPGDNNVTVGAYDNANFYGSALVTYVKPLGERSVLIMADEQSLDKASGASASARFTVMNTGAVTRTFTISKVCTGMGSCGTPSPASLVISAGQTAITTVTYTAPATVGNQGLMTVTATDATPPTISDQTWVEVNRVAAPAAGAVLANTGLGGSDVTEKSLCLTVSAGSGLAVECGELRSAHALPMVKTLNTARVPTLLYNSEQAHPLPIVHADVTLPTGDALPTTVEAVLTINGTQVTSSWNGTDWVPGETRRIAVQVDASLWATGLYPYTLQISRVTGT